MMKLTLYTVSSAKVHQKLKTGCLDYNRYLVYTSEADKGLIHAYSLRKRQSVGFIKMTNARVNRIVIDADMHRLYATSKSGIFMIFDIQNVQPILIHSMKCVLRPDLGTNYVKNIDLDVNKNIVVIQLKSSDILVIQLLARKDTCTIIERIKLKSDEQITMFKWLSRMKCYIEGTAKGLIRVKDIEKQGESMLLMQTEFTEKAQCVNYSLRKNILFMGCRDGQFKAWKVPAEWRSAQVDRQE